MKKASEHALPVERRGSNKSEQRMKPSAQGRRGTHFLSSAQGRASQDSERKPTSKGRSPTVEHRGIDKSGERKKACSKGYSRPIERRGRDRSGERKKADERWALTNCRAQRDGQIRTMKKKPMSEGHPRS